MNEAIHVEMTTGSGFLVDAPCYSLVLVEFASLETSLVHC